MLIRRGLGLTLVLLGVTAAVARAQTPRDPRPARFGVAGRVSTLGIGVDFGVPLMRRADLRVAVNQFGYSQASEDGGFNQAIKLKMRSVVVQFDWHPFKGGFHVSPGVMLYNGIRIDVAITALTNQPFSLGDETFVSSPSNPLSGQATVQFKKVAPTIAVGWGSLVPWKTTRRWSIPVELGLVVTRSPIATLRLNGSVCWVTGTNCHDLASDTGLQNDITKEQVEMNNDLKPVKLLPIVSVGFSYRF